MQTNQTEPTANTIPPALRALCDDYKRLAAADASDKTVAAAAWTVTNACAEYVRTRRAMLHAVQLLQKTPHPAVGFAIAALRDALNPPDHNAPPVPAFDPRTIVIRPGPRDGTVAGERCVWRCVCGQTGLAPTAPDAETAGRDHWLSVHASERPAGPAPAAGFVDSPADTARPGRDVVTGPGGEKLPAGVFELKQTSPEYRNGYRYVWVCDRCRVTGVTCTPFLAKRACIKHATQCPALK